jgi:CoA-transferase family III
MGPLDAATHREPAGGALWSALGGDPARAGDVKIRGRGRHLPSAFAVDDLAVGAVGCVLLAAADLADARGARRPVATLDAAHVACAFASERRLRRDGRAAPATFAPLSRFAPARDGFIRLHANYPHHRQALLTALGVGEEHALDAIAERDAQELEEAIVAAGGAAAAVRSPAAWAAHPQGRAVADGPLVERRAVPPAGAAGRPHSRPPAPDRPAAGVRVLDLTRVIAGPVATRTLAALGADVLRLDSPHLPEIEDGLLDTCPGKRLAALDLRDDAARATLHALLADADALVHGHRPGALDAFGLGSDALAERHPHLVVASVGAWGHAGPWRSRRGFDSLVQAACGIAVEEGAGGAPGALPVQALDHATGYLVAASVLLGIAARERGGGAVHNRFALAATAAELMRRRADGDGPAAAEDGCDRFRIELDHDGETLSLIAPPGALDGRALRWDGPPRSAAPVWERGDEPRPASAR